MKSNIRTQAAMAGNTESRPSSPHSPPVADDEESIWHPDGRPIHDQTPPPRWSPVSETQSWSSQDYLPCAQPNNRDSPSPTMPRRIQEAHAATSSLPRPVLPQPTRSALPHVQSSLPRIPALLTSPAIQPNVRFTNPIPRSRPIDTACTVTLTIVCLIFNPFTCYVDLCICRNHTH